MIGKLITVAKNAGKILMAYRGEKIKVNYKEGNKYNNKSRPGL